MQDCRALQSTKETIRSLINMSVAVIAALAAVGLKSRQNKRKTIDTESGYISGSPSTISTFYEESDFQVTLEDAIMNVLADRDIAQNILDKHTFAEVHSKTIIR